MKKILNFIYIHHYAALAAFCVILGMCAGLFWNYNSINYNLAAVVANVIIILTCFGTGMFFKIRNTLSEKKIITLIFIIGLSLRLVYILTLPSTSHQHDVEIFGNGSGHAGYIEYFLYNRSLPDFDPISVWQFYHPPLHHIICAVWMRLQMFIGVSYDSAIEGIQFLPFFYSGVCCIVCIKIFKSAGLKNLPFYLACLFVCVNPTFRFFSGSINNDCLCAMFMFLAVYHTINWYDNKRIRTILPVAICLGLGMITKLSAGLVAIGIAFVFLYALIKERAKARLIGQYAVFGAVCVPIGLSWTVRNLVMFNTPINYVPDLGSDNYQYIGNYSVLRRLFDFSPYQFSSPFIAWGEHSGDSYYEFNPTVGYLKTACFEEYFSDIKILPFIMLMAFCLCVVAALSGLVLFIIDLKKSHRRLPFAIVAVCTSVYFISYYAFCLKYPQVCTMNARYVPMAVLMIPMFFAYLIADFQNENSKLLKPVRLISVVSVCICCVMSVIIYSVVLI
ncbi:MAG: glycosyltransferase family 39 protein [Clostridiales bacterium]|nr:glycosyltransferase family 39 protein [Clostridiales bacterium]